MSSKLYKCVTCHKIFRDSYFMTSNKKTTCFDCSRIIAQARKNTCPVCHKICNRNVSEHINDLANSGNAEHAVYQVHNL